LARALCEEYNENSVSAGLGGSPTLVVSTSKSMPPARRVLKGAKFAVMPPPRTRAVTDLSSKSGATTDERVVRLIDERLQAKPLIAIESDRDDFADGLPWKSTMLPS